MALISAEEDADAIAMLTVNRMIRIREKRDRMILMAVMAADCVLGVVLQSAVLLLLDR